VQIEAIEPLFYKYQGRDEKRTKSQCRFWKLTGMIGCLCGTLLIPCISIEYIVFD
jgi:hypothetical protein